MVGTYDITNRVSVSADWIYYSGAPTTFPTGGYEDPVIMAAGAFIQGSSIELSADAPMRPPYTVYMQGGLTYESGKLGILLAAEELLKL